MGDRTCLFRRPPLAIAACAALLGATSAVAQDGLIVNGRYVSASRSLGADLGPAPRDLQWPLAGGGRFSVQEHVVVDRRTGRTVSVPDEARVLAVDPVRPRLFVRYDGHPFALISEFNAVTGGSRPLILIGGAQALWPERVRYAYSADRLLVDVTEGAPADPFVETPHPIKVFDGTTGVQVGGFTVSTLANGSGSTSPWLVTPDGDRAYFGAMTGLFAPAGFVKAVRVADGTTDTLEIPVENLQWDESNERLILYGEGVVRALSMDLHVLVSAPLDFYNAIRVSPHTGRLYVVSGQFHGIYGGDVHLAVVDRRTYASLGYANLGNARGATMSLVTVPGVPRGLRATVTRHEVNLAWTNVGAASAFVLDVGYVPGRADLRVYLGPDAHASFSNVPPGTYYVRLRGGNEFGGGVPTSEMQLVVP